MLEQPLALDGLARQEADEAPALRRQPGGHERREHGAGPRQHLERDPRRDALAHERETGVGYERRARVGYQRNDRAVADAHHELTRALAFVVLVQAHKSRGDAVAIEQHARVARVLARDHVGVAQGGEHAQRDVLEVADRGRAHDQPPDRRLDWWSSRKYRVLQMADDRDEPPRYTRYRARPRLPGGARTNSSVQETPRAPRRAGARRRRAAPAGTHREARMPAPPPPVAGAATAAPPAGGAGRRANASCSA